VDIVNQQPENIYNIRHAEKPGEQPGPHTCVDYHGRENEHSLLPRGWQRSGALVTLFDPARGGLRTPTVLLSPSHDKNAAHRTYQTLQGLSERFGVPIASPFAEGEEDRLAASLLREHAGVVLVCWDHSHLPALAAALPAGNRKAIPRKWPEDRYDVTWTFTLDPATGHYTFGQVPQRLLSGDADTVIG
jgi:hypothetical protein